MKLSRVPSRARCQVFAGIVALLVTSRPTAAAETNRWIQLFNGRDLSGWDTYLGPASGGYHDPATTKEKPIGLNTDPLGVFSVVELDGTTVIRVSGQVFGAITTKAEYDNHHIRVEYKWGKKKWPPRDGPQHHRDTGILYWCIGPQGAGSMAWMRSVECNVMERGVGQWWSVAGSYVDIEGKNVVLEREPWVPYPGEGPGEECIVYRRGDPQFTTAGGITSAIDPEKPHEWNVCEVIAWGNVGIHLLNGQVVLVLVNPRYKENDREFALTRGKVQLQSEGAEVFFRKVEVQSVNEIPSELLSHVPSSSPDEKGFVPLFSTTAHEGWAQSGPGQFKLENGVATGIGGMGLWWYTNRMFTNFVIRGEFLQEQEGADSGVFLRFPHPGQDPWVAVKQGHEVEIGEADPEKPTWRTGSVYPFKAASRANTKPPGQWNTYEITCVGQNYAVRINDKLVTTWTDPDYRTAAGFVGLQNYNDQIVRHRNVRIKDLPGSQ
ncbi:MAG TPA: DUF1080 domain-containing protein [Verrucomicrobiota bacterium]|nr:DUF1080 domain-containing protein [Verrucomicrobiota bacterium]